MIHTHTYFLSPSQYIFSGCVFFWVSCFNDFMCSLSSALCSLCTLVIFFITDWQRACAPVREARSLPAKSWWLRRLMVTATQDATGLHRCRNFGFDSRNATLYRLYNFLHFAKPKFYKTQFHPTLHLAMPTSLTSQQRWWQVFAFTLSTRFIFEKLLFPAFCSSCAKDYIQILPTHCTTRLHDYTTPDPGLHSVIRLVRTSVGQDWDAGIFHSTNLSRWDWRKLLNLMINAMVFFQCSPYQQIHSFRDHVLEHSRVKLPWTWRHLANPVASSFDKSAQARHGKRTPEPQQ